MVLPAGFELPPLGYLAVLAAVLVATGVVLVARRPPVTDRFVVALVPWIVAGAAMHVLYVLDGLPGWLAPLFGLPAVYLSTAAGLGLVWTVALVLGDDAAAAVPTLEVLATGIVLAGAATVGLGLVALEAGGIAAGWPAISLALAAVLTGAIWLGAREWLPATAGTTGASGVVVVFGHTLDGVSTAVGIDVLGGVERSPLADLLIQLGAQLPVVPVFETTWLFLLVKVALAVAILVLFRPFVADEPTRGHLLLALVAAVGLGPGVHNLLLAAVTP